MVENVSFQSLLEKAKKGTAYWVSRTIERFSEDLFLLMKERGVSKSDLAKRLGKSPAYVTKILRGQSNFTIESMVVLARALDAELDVHITPVRNAALEPVINNGVAYAGHGQSAPVQPIGVLNPNTDVVTDFFSMAA